MRVTLNQLRKRFFEVAIESSEQHREMCILYTNAQVFHIFLRS